MDKNENTTKQMGDIAMLIDLSRDGILLAWGDPATVSAKYTALTEGMSLLGLNPDTIVSVTLDKSGLGAKERGYVLRRCIEYTASGFPKELYRRIRNNENLSEWLQDEMSLMPIDPYE